MAKYGMRQGFPTPGNVITFAAELSKPRLRYLVETESKYGVKFLIILGNFNRAENFGSPINRVAAFRCETHSPVAMTCRVWCLARLCGER